MASLPHPVLVLLRHFAQLTAEIDVDFEVHVTLVSFVWLHPEHPVDFLSFLGRDCVLHVENSLFPVRVGSLGCCGETDSLVTLGELDVEERYQSLGVVVALDLKGERRVEGNVVLGAGLSSIAQMYMVALSGNMRPSGANHLSLAYRTLSSIDS